jgi:pimeloyl-ACP methyl ester carboxylesterase
MWIRVPTLILWDMKDVARTRRMACPRLDHCDEGKLILFPDSTHWVQLDAAEEVNYYLINLLLDKNSKR